MKPMTKEEIVNFISRHYATCNDNECRYCAICANEVAQAIHDALPDIEPLSAEQMKPVVKFIRQNAFLPENDNLQKVADIVNQQFGVRDAK